MSFKAKTELRKRKEFYIELTIDDIRSMFCFSDTEYKKTNDLKRFVIEPALKEINDQTDLSITDIQFLKKEDQLIRFTSQPSLK